MYIFHCFCNGFSTLLRTPYAAPLLETPPLVNLSSPEKPLLALMLTGYKIIKTIEIPLVLSTAKEIPICSEIIIKVEKLFHDFG